MKNINKMDFEGYLEDATRVLPDGIVYLDGKRTKFLLRIMHEQFEVLSEKLNECVEELNFQRTKRMDLEQRQREYHPELAPKEEGENNGTIS